MIFKIKMYRLLIKLLAVDQVIYELQISFEHFCSVKRIRHHIIIDSTGVASRTHNYYESCLYQSRANHIRVP